MGNLFSFEGRVGRGTWWMLFAASVVVGGILGLIMGSEPGGGMTLVLGLVYIGMILISWSINVRRWHDLGKSGWWMLISLVPLVGWLYALAMCGFVAGDPGPNQYGPAPDGSVVPASQVA